MKELELIGDIKSKQIPIQAIDSKLTLNTIAKSFQKHEKTHLYATNAAGEGGYYKFINPTQKYTKLFINDEDNVEVAFQVPRLGAKCFTDSAKYFETVLTSLTTDKKYADYNTSGIANGWMLTKFDYISLVPEELHMGDDELTPLSQFIFDTVVRNLCRWNLVIGLEDNMSLMKISTILQKQKYGADMQPQTLYAKSCGNNGICGTKNNVSGIYLSKNPYYSFEETYAVKTASFSTWNPFSVTKK